MDATLNITGNSSPDGVSIYYLLTISIKKNHSGKCVHCGLPGLVSTIKGLKYILHKSNIFIRNLRANLFVVHSHVFKCWVIHIDVSFTRLQRVSVCLDSHRFIIYRRCLSHHHWEWFTSVSLDPSSEQLQLVSLLPCHL